MRHVTFRDIIFIIIIIIIISIHQTVVYNNPLLLVFFFFLQFPKFYFKDIREILNVFFVLSNRYCVILLFSRVKIRIFFKFRRIFGKIKNTMTIIHVLLTNGNAQSAPWFSLQHNIFGFRAFSSDSKSPRLECCFL